ncbi:hypothetical protein KC909_06845 [Candidatus Dojkabacteria bacterium]|uniref:SprT-like domain-containing protein n=1 Tax=Candidatus Dojkabacteria bacterium TaxID=2099670 RepID=A0A955L6S7_9BACT|nr:hypothetical protein [Candidatus Dojkabacteria bacterium]
MRDNLWLSEKMYEIWENHFEDIPRKNRVLIKFSKRSYRQLGCIKWAKDSTRGLSKLVRNNPAVEDEDKRISLINITGYFKDEFVPDDVVSATIAHELCHYAHGFNSPLQQLYEHPHKGGVIRKEMSKRGLGMLYKEANKWLKENWEKYVRYQKGIT